MSLDPELDDIFATRLQELKSLRVRVHKGLHLSADRANGNFVDGFFKGQLAPPEDWEKFFNHEHVFDSFFGLQDMTLLEALTTEIKTAWEEVLAALSGQYRVVRYEDDNGPTLTFYLDRGTPAGDIKKANYDPSAWA